MRRINILSLPGCLEDALAPVRFRGGWRELRPTGSIEVYPLQEAEMGSADSLQYAEAHLLGSLLAGAISRPAREALSLIPGWAHREIRSATSTVLEAIAAAQQQASGISEEDMDAERCERLRHHAVRMVQAVLSRQDNIGGRVAADVVATLTDPDDTLWAGPGLAPMWAAAVVDRARAAVLRRRLRALANQAEGLASADIQAAIRLCAEEVAIYG